MRDLSRRAALAVSTAGAVLLSRAAVSQAPAKVERDFVTTPAGQIHVRRAGEGAEKTKERTPLYCFHQSPQSSFVYADILPYLAQDRVVTACDTPGFGESFRPAAQPTIGDYAEWLAEVPKSQGHAQIDVVGMFTGSAIAVEMQRRVPKLIRRMVLIGPALFEEEQRKQMYANAWPAIPEETGAFLQAEWAKVMSRYPKSMTFEQKFNLFNEYYRGGMNAIFGERAVNSYDMRSALPGVSVPVLIIEPEGSFGRGEEAASLIRNAKYIRATGKFGLGLLQTEPQWVAAQILPFLNA